MIKEGVIDSKWQIVEEKIIGNFVLYISYEIKENGNKDCFAIQTYNKDTETIKYKRKNIDRDPAVKSFVDVCNMRKKKANVWITSP